MRHRIKKIPTLSKLSHKFNHHLLHSDKSTYTYFYKGKVKVGSLGKHILYSPSIPLLGGAVLLLVLGLMISPILNTVQEANALTAEECGNDPKVSLTMAGVTEDNITLTNNNVSDDIDAGKVSKIAQDFTVEACRNGGYKIYIQSDSSILKNQDAPDGLSGVGANVAEADFPENTWGYNISLKDATNIKYKTVPELSDTIPSAYSVGANTGYSSKDLTLNFAAKFGKNKAAGHYTSDILLSLVIEPFIVVTVPEEFLGFTSINNMQDMTPEVCAAASIGETKQLKDTRDNKYYWVSKLNDENCWMTQNLDLDLKNGTSLTPSDSDVTSNWNPGQTTITGILNSSIWPSNNAENNIRSYDAGKYIYSTPTIVNGCQSTNGLGDCTGKGWINVNEANASPDPNFGTEVNNNTYNAHYLSGNYYSWAAATAGQGNTITSTNSEDYPAETTQSICPKGWKLPSSSDNNNTINGSFYNLLTAYGTKNGLNYGSQNIKTAPLYFLYGGSTSNKLEYAGSSGRYWSSTANNDRYAYCLILDSGGISPSSINARSVGQSIRCVAR